MNATDAPAMSFVILTIDRYDRIRQTIRHLAAQSVARLLEVVIVAPSRQTLEPDLEELSAFHSWRVAEIGLLESSSAARVAGIRAASAPIVAFGEDHSFPQAGWAEALLKAHEGPWAVVGPMVRNANPATPTSWANFLVEYGRWVSVADAGEHSEVAGHNSAYKRDLLLAYGPALVPLLDAECVLHWDMRAKGQRVLMEPAAVTEHLNPSRMGPWLPNRFRAGRSFAGSRARGWPWWRRLYYTLGAFFLPVRIGPRLMRLARRAGLTQSAILRLLPALFMYLVADGLGRAAGYAFGFRGRNPSMVSLEFDRLQFLDERDRQAEAQRRPVPAN